MVFAPFILIFNKDNHNLNIDRFANGVWIGSKLPDGASALQTDGFWGRNARFARFCNPFVLVPAAPKEVSIIHQQSDPSSISEAIHIPSAKRSIFHHPSAKRSIFHIPLIIIFASKKRKECLKSICTPI
jgi:hypothetical protein